MALIRKQYAAPVLADEMNKIISENLSTYIQKENIEILGNPIPETSTEASGNWEKPEQFIFTFEIGLAPQISLEFGRSAKFIRHIIKVDKKAIEAATKDHCRRHGSISEPEVASDSDLIMGHFVSSTLPTSPWKAASRAIPTLLWSTSRTKSRANYLPGQKWAIRSHWIP